ncbi:MAG: DUF134 domain-containing protein [Clostridia bacterium]|nr:DUF134 domain-containing protein [Clostridia bacterium]
MPRPIKPRRISVVPKVHLFKPAGARIKKEDCIVLNLEELEALKLKDIDGLDQQTCADQMEVSRQTLQLILESARKKVATALIEGRGLSIEGGYYNYGGCDDTCPRCRGQRMCRHMRDTQEE